MFFCIPENQGTGVSVNNYTGFVKFTEKNRQKILLLLACKKSAKTKTVLPDFFITFA
jgi:hypothetical protein